MVSKIPERGPLANHWLVVTDRERDGDISTTRAIPGLVYPSASPMCRRVETRLNLQKGHDNAAL